MNIHDNHRTKLTDRFSYIKQRPELRRISRDPGSKNEPIGMRYKTFRAIVGTTAVTAAAGGVFFWNSSGGSQEADAPPPPPAATQPAAGETQPAPPVPAPPTGGVPDSMREVDKAAFSLQGATVEKSKAKDVFKGRPYKVNVYADPPSTTVTRLKIDLDRDNKWDEKWTFKGLQVKRQVAPADDEKYTQEFVLDQQQWKKVR